MTKMCSAPCSDEHVDSVYIYLRDSGEECPVCTSGGHVIYFSEQWV